MALIYISDDARRLLEEAAFRDKRKLVDEIDFLASRRLAEIEVEAQVKISKNDKRR